MHDTELVDEAIKALGLTLEDTYGEKVQFDVVILIPEGEGQLGLSVAGHTCPDHLPQHLRSCADHMEKSDILQKQEAH